MTFSKLSTNTFRIIYLMGWGNYTRVFLIDSSPELNATTLKKCVDTLPSFIRLSKSLAVNPTHITQIRRNSDRSAEVLVAGQWLHVSRRRVPSVVSQYQNFSGAVNSDTIHSDLPVRPVLSLQGTVGMGYLAQQSVR